MKFTMYRTSDFEKKTEIKIGTLKELIALVDKEGKEVIIIPKTMNHLGTDYQLEIYDTYRE